MAQLLESAEKTRPSGDACGEQLEGGVDHQAEEQAEEDDGTRGQADLAVHGPLGCRGGGGTVQVTTRRDPGGGPAFEAAWLGCRYGRG